MSRVLRIANCLIYCQLAKKNKIRKLFYKSANAYAHAAVGARAHSFRCSIKSADNISRNGARIGVASYRNERALYKSKNVKMISYKR